MEELPPNQPTNPLASTSQQVPISTPLPAQASQPYPLHRLFFSKFNLLLIILFILTNAAIFFLATHNLMIFAQNASVFTISQSNNLLPALLLQSSFSCIHALSYFFCGADVFLLWGFIIFFEIFVLIKLYTLRKSIGKVVAFLYLFCMQSFIALTVLILLSPPAIVTQQLTIQGTTVIANSFTKLNNPLQQKTNGIITNAQTIKDTITNAPITGFQIVESQPAKNAVLQLLQITPDKKDTFFRSIVLSTTLNTYVRQKNPILTADLLYFPNKTLIVNNTRLEDITIIFPTLTRKMLEAFLPAGDLSKSDPQIAFLDNAEYIVYQKQEEEKIKKEFESYIASIKTYLDQADAALAQNQRILENYPLEKQQHQQTYDDYVAKWGNWYTSCISKTVELNTCEDGKENIETNIQILLQNIKAVDENVKKAEENLALQKRYKEDTRDSLLIAEENYKSFLKNPIKAELQAGVFHPPSSIYIRFFSDKKRTLSFYLGTTVHEYLHYYSYTPANQLDVFLEEGYTDYLTQKIEKQYVDPKSVGVGYVYEVAVIEELLKHIPEEKMTAIYFAKNQKSLQELFAKKYNTTTYDTFLLEGKNLFYTSLEDKQQREAYVESIKRILSTTTN